MGRVRVYEDLLILPINTNLDVVCSILGKFFNSYGVTTALPKTEYTTEELSILLSPIQNDISVINNSMFNLLNRIRGFIDTQSSNNLKSLVITRNDNKNHYLRIDIYKEEDNVFKPPTEILCIPQLS